MKQDTTAGYGAVITPGELVSFMDVILDSNCNGQDYPGINIPLCIWGPPGIGKTQIVRDYAASRNWRFAYCAPAQFEEMGDFHGIPVSVDGKTVYHPPKWVPEGEGPGILLIDDINRADDRILRGLMQLMQNSGLMSWSLPKGWHIIATANPEMSDYSVTTMDDAMLTRMLHVSLGLDVKYWVEWALQNGVDERGINFVLTYPEIVNCKRTNPRSLTNLFYQTRKIRDLKAHIKLVHTLALSFVDAETAASFIGFVMNELSLLIPPEDIINADSFAQMEKKIMTSCMGDDNNLRMDRLSTISTRLLLMLLSERTTSLSAQQKSNLLNFMLMDVLPNDLRMAMNLEISKKGPEEVKSVFRNKKLATLILGASSN